ncbi:hypothetical protein [Jiella pacifica]|uniref:Phage tail protein n=1 Tax=Jiella pacifica TaxID=2696469 RepID=A0A6N9T216_9HYPH|nr:hypothetical protein [Jiella pacifica]NDW04076.1 hypothetical protein [Jiella pacifica]
MNVWPATLLQHAEREGFRRGFGDGRLSTPTEAGPTRTRRRFSYVPEPLQCAFQMTDTQLATFKAFVADTLRGGTLPFRMPAQREDGEWIVKFGETMPSPVPARTRTKWLVTLDLVRLP